MNNNGSENLKEYAESLFLRSKDEVSNDKEILDKLKDKIVIIKETNSVEVIFKHSSPQVRIPLYLIGKFVGHKILGLTDGASADTTELSKNLNMPVKGLARPIGILLNQKLIEKTGRGFQVRAFKIVEFLDSLVEEQKTNSNQSKRRAKSKVGTRKSKNTRSIKEDLEPALEYKGLDELCEFLNLSEEKLKKILFVRENDITLIDMRFINSANTREIQLDTSLALLLIYKYVFGLNKFPSALLRKKLQLLGVKSLTNLTTNLHKHPEHIIHEAGKIGSTDNYFLVTQPGENKIKEQIREYLKERGDKNEN